MNTKGYKEEIFTLERFNMNAKKVKSSKFFEWFLENSLNVEFLVTKEYPRSGFPPDSHLEAFLIIFRKCVVDDESSVTAVSKIYNNLNSETELKAQFNDFQEGLNKCLNGKPFKEISKVDDSIQNLTLQEVMDVFLYGEFIDNQPEKVALYKKISQNKLIREFYWLEFYMTVYKCALLIFHISLLNESLLKEFQASG